MDQRQIADCYFLAAVRSLCHVAPLRARALVTDFGDGTYGAAFVRGGIRTVVRTSAALSQFADTPDVDGVAAVAILEKCYARFRSGTNTYASLNYGNATAAMNDLGLVATDQSLAALGDAALLALVAQTQAAGKACVVDTIGTLGPLGNGWVASHSYALISGTNTGTFKVLNPYGYMDVDNVSPALLRANCATVHYEV